MPFSSKYLLSELEETFNPERIIVTTCDADSYFHPSYISALTAKFLQEKNPHGVIFQAPLLYNWGLDRVSFVTRVTGLLRSTLMMGALIPFNINSMSIFSFSLCLCMDGNFVHPTYQMDKGAELASATVPWHWLCFASPRSYAIKICLEIMLPKK